MKMVAIYEVDDERYKKILEERGKDDLKWFLMDCVAGGIMEYAHDDWVELLMAILPDTGETIYKKEPKPPQQYKVQDVQVM